MGKSTYPSDNQDRYIVRFPDGMRDEIRRAAYDNGRTMNAEIVHRMSQAKLDPVGVISPLDANIEPLAGPNGLSAGGGGEQTSFRLEPLTARLALVSEARELFGCKAARLLWIDLGLPTNRYSNQSIHQIEKRPAHTVAFVEQCVSNNPHAPPIAAAELYRLYCAFTIRQGRTPVNMTAFGREMSATFRKDRTSGIVLYHEIEIRSGRRRKSAESPPTGPLPAASNAVTATGRIPRTPSKPREKPSEV